MICNIYAVRDNNDAIRFYIAEKRALLFRFSSNICDSLISDSIACIQNLACNILTLKDDIDIVFFGYSLHGILQNLACNILTLRENINIIFDGVT